MSAPQHSSTVETPAWLNIVREKVESLSYGIVQIVVHDNKITQIERTERVRLESTLRETRGNRARH